MSISRVLPEYRVKSPSGLLIKYRTEIRPSRPLLVSLVERRRQRSFRFHGIKLHRTGLGVVVELIEHPTPLGVVLQRVQIEWVRSRRGHSLPRPYNLKLVEFGSPGTLRVEVSCQVTAETVKFSRGETPEVPLPSVFVQRSRKILKVIHWSFI